MLRESNRSAFSLLRGARARGNRGLVPEFCLPRCEGDVDESHKEYTFEGGGKVVAVLLGTGISPRMFAVWHHHTSKRRWKSLAMSRANFCLLIGVRFFLWFLVAILYNMRPTGRRGLDHKFIVPVLPSHLGRSDVQRAGKMEDKDQLKPMPQSLLTSTLNDTVFPTSSPTNTSTSRSSKVLRLMFRASTRLIPLIPFWTEKWISGARFQDFCVLSHLYLVWVSGRRPGRGGVEESA